MSEQKLVLSAVKQKDFAGNNLCDWTIFYILREEIFADCDNPKLLMELRFCGLSNFYATGNKRKILWEKETRFFVQ